MLTTATWKITSPSRTRALCRLLHQIPHRRRSVTRTGRGSRLVTLGPLTGLCGRRVGHQFSACRDAVADDIHMTYVLDSYRTRREEMREKSSGTGLAGQN